MHFNDLVPEVRVWHAIGKAGIRPTSWGAGDARTLRAALAALVVLTCAVSTATATSRIKDLANIEGIRQNQLIGYGLVVGLNGTGDTLNNTPFTKQSLQGMLERLGVNIRGQQIRTGNVAAVMVTANLPPFATQGTRIDVTASAMGDSKSLLGGTLLVTPLLGADGNVYAVAQGSLAIGGFQAEGEAAKVTRGVPTVGRLPNGAIIEREIEFSLATLGHLRLSLRNRRLHHRQAHRHRHQRLYRLAGRRAARPVDRAAHAAEEIPAKPRGDAHRDRAVAGRAGRGRQDRHRRALAASSSSAATCAYPRSRWRRAISRSRSRNRRRSVSRRRSREAAPSWCRAPMSAWSRKAKSSRWCSEGVSLQQIVDGLNALGIGPRDLISILQAIKAAGAIQADIEVM